MAWLEVTVALAPLSLRGPDPAERSSSQLSSKICFLDVVFQNKVKIHATRTILKAKFMQHEPF